MKRGERLIPVLIDELALTSPNQLFAKVPQEPNVHTSYRDVTISDLANAINHAAWWMEQHFGRSDSFETLSYAGPSDLRIITLIIAAVKTGHKLFLLSTGFQTAETYVNLLEAYQCSKYLTPATQQVITTQVLERRDMKTFTVPELDAWFSPSTTKAPVYPYNKTYAQARLEPFTCLHTSGSTGPPKPVIINHGTITGSDLFPELTRMNGRKLNSAEFEGTRMLFGMPMFHSAVVMFLAYTIYHKIASVISPVWPVTAAVADAVHASGHVDGSCFNPNVLIELSSNAAYLENIKKLKYLTFGGAPLPRAVGERLKNLTHLFTSFGTTETGYFILEYTEPDEWEYLRFSPFMGCELRDIGDGLYQLWFVKQDSLMHTQSIFATFSTLDSYTTKDVYSKHPSIDGLWLCKGRVDDLLVMSTSKKFNPIELEKALQHHPMVSGVVVCGNNRTSLSVLIETRDGTDDATAREEIWPHIESLNANLPPWAQLQKSLVLFTTKDRPMVRAEKGSVIRRRTMALYETELDKAYARV